MVGFNKLFLVVLLLLTGCSSAALAATPPVTTTSVQIVLSHGCTGNLDVCFSQNVAINNNGQCWAEWDTASGVYGVPLPFLTLHVIPQSPTTVRLTIYFAANATTGGINSKVNIFCG